MGTLPEKSGACRKMLLFRHNEAQARTLVPPRELAPLPVLHDILPADSRMDYAEFQWARSQKNLGRAGKYCCLGITKLRLAHWSLRVGTVAGPTRYTSSCWWPYVERLCTRVRILSSNGHVPRKIWGIWENVAVQARGVGVGLTSSISHSQLSMGGVVSS